MEINGASHLYGIIGYPVSHSLSPAVHNAAFRFYGMNAVYVPFELRSPGAFLRRALPCLGIRGLSVTIPHKGWAAGLADRQDRLTALCQAANTLIFRSNGIMAFNTDGAGAMAALRERVTELENRRYLILGYGGSAAAIAGALLLEQKRARITVAGRNLSRCRSFAAAMKRRLPAQKERLESADFSKLRSEDIEIIINTTPLGMRGRDRALPLPSDFVDSSQTIFDIVYSPVQTPLLELARQRGAGMVPGYLMFLHQAALQFRLFSRKEAPLELMRRELRQHLKIPLEQMEKR